MKAKVPPKIVPSKKSKKAAALNGIKSKPVTTPNGSVKKLKNKEKNAAINGNKSIPVTTQNENEKTLKNKKKNAALNGNKSLPVATPNGSVKKLKNKKKNAALNGNKNIPVTTQNGSLKKIKNKEEDAALNGNKSVKKLKNKEKKAVKKSLSSTKNDKPLTKEKKPKSKTDIEKHKKELESLKNVDPEFYKFLKQNDKKLLDFNILESDEDDNEEENQEKEMSEENDDDDKYHKPSADLDVASDESDFEDEIDEDIDDDETDSKTITLKLLRTWQTKLQKPTVPIDIVRKICQAFNSALASVAGDESKVAVYKVDGPATFNGIVQLCILHLQPAIFRFLGLSLKSKIPIHKTKKWTKIRSCLRSYLLDLARLLDYVSSSNILSVVLKHLHQMSGMLLSFASISKQVLKRLIVLWSTSDETVRVLSFLCILKITRTQQGSMLNHVLKAMYLSYVRNSKFVSPNTLPGINFMRRSLVEMFALDLNVAYQHVFLYIRQLAIHLRNAIILKKKDSFQSVYNWQFVNSVKLWTDLLGSTNNKPQLQPLVYPLVSITTGVIKLIPTAQYFPLRFHCIQSLITLAKSTNTFIPILPFILEVLSSNTFNKKHTVASMKPMSFACLLRLNKSQMAENGFRDEVVENICSFLLEYLSFESCSMAYPDLVVPTVCTLKQYIKSCKNANHSRKLKQVLDKIIDNSKFIENERRKVTFGLKDTNLIQSWEIQIRNKGTPLDIYYNSWVKTHEVKKRRQAADTDNINDYDIPMIKRPKSDKSSREDKDNNGVVLFPSDSEDDDNMELDADSEEESKTKKPKKLEKVKKQPTVSVKTDNVEENFDEKVDIVKDLDLDDW